MDLGGIFKSLSAVRKRGIDQKDRELAREKTESKWPRFDLSRHREAPSTKGREKKKKKRTRAKDGFEEERAPFDRHLRYLPTKEPTLVEIVSCRSIILNNFYDAKKKQVAC